MKTMNIKCETACEVILMLTRADEWLVWIFKGMKVIIFDCHVELLTAWQGGVRLTIWGGQQEVAIGGYRLESWWLYKLVLNQSVNSESVY